jgi:hypothetical protein
VGLFSSRTQTYVGTTTSRLIEDRLLPDSLTTGVLKAIRQEGDIPEYMFEEMLGSIGQRAARMYEYARRKYPAVMPSGSYLDASQGSDEVQDVLEALEEAPVHLVYCHYAPANLLHQGWMQLVSQYGYNAETNEIASLSAAKGKTVYLTSLTVVVPPALADSLDPLVLAQWGPSSLNGYTPTRVQVLSNNIRQQPAVEIDASVSQPSIRVAFSWNTGRLSWSEDGPLPEIEFDTLLMPLPEADPEHDFFHVRYQVGGIAKFWMYRARSGVYPSLDTFHDDSFSQAGTYFPRVYFRLGKQDLSADKTSADYRHRKKMLNYLGIGYEQLADAIHENPDVADVEQAFLTMGVPADSADPIERRYLFDYFKRLHGQSPHLFQQPQEYEIFGQMGNPLGRQAIVIRDAFHKTVLSFNAIYLRRVAGSIGPVGSYDSASEDMTLYSDIYDPEAGPQARTGKARLYRHQVTRGFYDEVRVEDLEMRYFVLGQYYTTSSDDDGKILLVPVDASITEDYNITDREDLYARSLHMVFNSVQYVKVRWYQSFFFQGVLFFIAAVVTVLSLGSSGGAFAAALQSGSAAAISAAAWALLVEIAWGFVISIGLRLFVKAVGMDLAFLIAIVAAVAGGVQAIRAGSIQGAPWAKELLSLASGLSKAIGAELKTAYQDLLQEFSDLQNLMKEQTQLLEDANKLLENRNVLSPFVIFGEAPNDYYNRTVHSGNIGVLSISAISSYVDIALRLPKLTDTLGEELA